MSKSIGVLCAVSMLIVASSCAVDTASDPGVGSTPVLPQPTKSLIPTVNIAPAIGWPNAMAPTPVKGLEVNAFASALSHPRWIYVLPNGDVLVAETNAPTRPDDGKGIRRFLMDKVLKKAGAAVASANRITLLRDSSGNGVAETRSVFLQNLNSPFGMALVGDHLYIANTDAVMRFKYTQGATRITMPGTKIADLPAGTINHHWTKNIIASRDGKFLYVTVGSNSNIAENGMENEKHRAGILEIDLATGRSRSFASGLRNPNGLGWEPKTGNLWTVVNERDELGNNLAPDYMTAVKDGGFYGWPYSYYGRHVDTRVKPPRPDIVATAMSPDYALGSHTASLGLTFNEGHLLPERFAGGAFIGQHGSWNRKPRSGYKVIFVAFANGHPKGLPEDVLTGFLNTDGDAMGRPVGVAIDRAGALLVADDVGNVIWRVTPTGNKR